MQPLSQPQVHAAPPDVAWPARIAKGVTEGRLLLTSGRHSMKKVRKSDVVNFFRVIARSSLQVQGLTTLSVVNRIIYTADCAITSRQTEFIGQASDSLENMSLPRIFEAPWCYYKALSIHDFGRGNQAEALKLLGSVIDSGPSSYQARALLSAGAIQLKQGRFDSAIRLYREAHRAALSISDPVLNSFTRMNIAEWLSIQGNHKESLIILESLRPYVTTLQKGYPAQYCNYLNSLAVELAELGRLEEARHASRIALTSPFASAYPEWHETHDEIALKMRRASRSIIALNSWEFKTEPSGLTGNLISMPAPVSEKSAEQVKFAPARVLTFPVKNTDDSLEGSRHDELPLPVASKPLKCKTHDDTDYTIDCAQVRTLTLRFLDASGKERMKVEVRQDEDGSIVDVWTRDKDGNGNAFFSTCFADNPAMEIDLP